MASLLWCGPKLAACGLVLSIWGVIMLVLLGIFFNVHSAILLEDVPLQEKDIENDDLQAVHKSYEQMNVVPGQPVYERLGSSLMCFKPRPTQQAGSIHGWRKVRVGAMAPRGAIRRRSQSSGTPLHPCCVSSFDRWDVRDGWTRQLRRAQSEWQPDEGPETNAGEAEKSENERKSGSTSPPARCRHEAAKACGIGDSAQVTQDRNSGAGCRPASPPSSSKQTCRTLL
uniref:Uncharacterized protein n=1 Tax=Eptatretus burgeri TaxID=7764 RepID=A0A8C4X0U2_EPTBU